MSEPIPVIPYRSAEVSEPAGEWVAGPGTLRLTLVPGRRLPAISGAGVRLAAVLVVGGMIVVAATSIGGPSELARAACPLVAVVGFAALVVRATATLVRVARNPRGPTVTVVGGVLTLADPARTARRVRIVTAEVVEVSTVNLLHPRSSAGVVRVRLERTDGHLVTYDLRTGDARCGWRLEAEVRRALQLTPGTTGVSIPL